VKYRVRVDSLSGNSVQRVQREIDVYDRISRRFSLDPHQQRIVHSLTDRLRADLDVEKGKSYMLGRDYVSARAAFRRANLIRNSFKLRALLALLWLAPTLLTLVYRHLRPQELAYIPVHQKDTECHR
jgi:hypothetical protein